VTFTQPLTSKVSVKGVKAAVNVTLQRRASTSQTWSDVETKATDAKGDTAFISRPRRNDYYRAIARTTPEQISSEALVKVAPLVRFRVSDSTPRAGSRVRFSGTVRPPQRPSRLRAAQDRHRLLRDDPEDDPPGRDFHVIEILAACACAQLRDLPRAHPWARRPRHGHQP
jgi:hypothetical protein